MDRVCEDNGWASAFPGVDVPSRTVDSRSLIKDSHAYQEIPKDQERRDSFEVRGLIRLVASPDMAGYEASLFAASLIKCKADTLNFIPTGSNSTLLSLPLPFLFFYRNFITLRRLFQINCFTVIDP